MQCDKFLLVMLIICLLSVKIDNLFLFKDNKLYVLMTDKGQSVKAKRKIIKGETLFEYKGKLCPLKVFRKNQLMYSKRAKRMLHIRI